MSALTNSTIRSSRPVLLIQRLVLASVLGAGISQLAYAQGAKPAAPSPSFAAETVQLAAIDPRWSASMDAFSAADQRQAPQPGGVVFVGSSSIRLWNDLETSFSDQPVIIKRGFGGSQLIDCVKLVHRLVLPYKPRMVVVYAGENDLAEGVSPWAVTQRFADFVRTVKTELPDARIAFVSIKPSPSRAGLMAAVRETNQMIKAYSLTEPRLDFIDVYSQMVDAKGQPRPELFLGDRLHLNADGYAVWQRVIAQHLKG
ncbi:SGNH/GDSL hydrolase family protein [Hydrogenophaga sp.]|uniref:SGNH/GDSL hydrolase family protein n=1 Tax=Hydrogenophaga sp. TaxID=1904254 RepID=UPI0027184BE8|nr:SGNH/GDSL hydrolase family protein [Hydrogenophaga sp.]MDO9438887.1 SGNH/GDSL hydrolase family protein [Hydrogenophaga sp.]